MKSKSAAFNCSGCWFADVAGQFDKQAIQIGCEAGRDNIFIDPVTGRTDFMDFPKYRSLNRFCNMYRTIDWALDKGGQNNIYLHDDEYMVELARKESAPNFAIGIFDNCDSTLEDIRTTLDSIVAAIEKYGYKKKIATVMSFGPHRSLGDTLHIANIYNEKMLIRGITHAYDDTNLSLVQHRETEVFMKFPKANYYAKIKPGDKVPEIIFSDVNTTINKSLDKILVFNYGGVHIINGPLVRSQYLEVGGDFNDMQAQITDQCKQEGFYKEV